MTAPFSKHPDTTALLGAALMIAGAWLLHDAYESRGRDRPFLLKFLPS
jgi:hypothetical protein